MPKLQNIKSEIEEIRKLKDIADIMSALAASNLRALDSIVKLVPRLSVLLNLDSGLGPYISSSGNTIAPEKKAETDFQASWKSFFRLRSLLETDKPLCTITSSSDELSKTPGGHVAVLGSNMGFCGRLNGVMKGVASQFPYAVALGKQMRSSSISHPIPLPEIFSGQKNTEPKVLVNAVREFVAGGILSPLYTNQSVNRKPLLSVFYHARTISGVRLLRCDIDISEPNDENVTITGQVNAADEQRFTNVFFDLYTRDNSKGDNTNFFVFDPDYISVLRSYSQLKRQWIESILVSVIVENMIAENFQRSSAMESAKDEAVNQIALLNKRYAKERQSKVTSELIELITSFSSLNEAA